MYVGTPAPRSDPISGARTLRRCPNGCGFYLKRLGPCPECGDEARFNKRLRTAILDNHLLEQAAAAEANK